MTNPTIHLQYVGAYPAKPVQDLKIGETVVWNFGSTSKVTGFIRETKAQLIVEFTDEHGTHERRMKKTRLVACREVLEALRAA